MSRLDRIHSNLMKRMSIVIRDIWVEVEATVKDYQKEAAQTRSENARLKQQLRDVLSRNQAHLNGVHYVPPDEASPTELPACGYGSPAESEDPEDQQTEGEAQSQASPSELKPRILDVISVCKTEAEDRELVHQKDVSSVGEQRINSSSTDETLYRNAATVATQRVKTEPEDTIITITSSVTTTPAHAGPRQDSEPAHQTRTASNASTLLKRAQKKDCLRSRYTMPRRASAKDHAHEEPYRCNKCGRQLKDLAKLQLHKKLHERSFICHWCGRNFSKFDYLRMHMRTHTGERPYRCHWCSKTFSQSGNMRRHERTCRNFNEESTSHGLEDQHLSGD
ncbi:zinc finger protein 135-like [Carassius gibelio]|uniref:zinc finger protein 135-like n=1 Tax=Carassius gibelio TaxID=101364 RepID=UPI0022790551|nr:zinc finger protein 135-like [Carassius gibelio]